MKIQIWCLPVSPGHVGEGLNTGTVVAVFLALVLKPHNSVSPCFSLALFELLSVH